MFKSQLIRCAAKILTHIIVAMLHPYSLTL